MFYKVHWWKHLEMAYFRKKLAFIRYCINGFSNSLSLKESEIITMFLKNMKSIKHLPNATTNTYCIFKGTSENSNKVWYRQWHTVRWNVLKHSRRIKHFSDLIGFFELYTPQGGKWQHYRGMSERATSVAPLDFWHECNEVLSFVIFFL